MDYIQFFDIFEKEINSYNKSNVLKEYYKFTQKDALYYWRKVYLLQRLKYIQSQINITESTSKQIWDVGCGYGTSSIFLSLNGIKSIGSTLEWHHKYIPERKKYWEAYGNTDQFTVKVENIFETSYEAESFDYILVQDTLHHLEPIDKALAIFSRVLKKDGKIIIIEENGNNILQRLKLYLRRGNKRIIEYFDENLKKNISIGNENIRPLEQWEKIFNNHGFKISNIQYIRFLPPFFINNNYNKLVETEQNIWKKSALLRDYFYWGLNFTAER
jgi:SAM-dependent methyltransferase